MYAQLSVMAQEKGVRPVECYGPGAIAVTADLSRTVQNQHCGICTHRWLRSTSKLLCDYLILRILAFSMRTGGTPINQTGRKRHTVNRVVRKPVFGVSD